MARATILANCFVLCLLLGMTTGCKKEELTQVVQAADSLYTDPGYRDTYVGNYEGISMLKLVNSNGDVEFQHYDSSATATVLRDNTTAYGLVFNAPDGQEWKVPGSQDLVYIGDWSIGQNDYWVNIQYQTDRWLRNHAIIRWTMEYPEGRHLIFSYVGIKTE